MLCLLTGCRTTHRDAREAELRARDRDLREMRLELARLDHNSYALQRELAGARNPRAFTPEAAAQLFTLKSVTLGRGTGGIDDDRYSGDEALMVVLEPRDAEDQVLKTPGTLHVTALVVTPDGLKTPFSVWEIQADELRKHWRQGLFSTGYTITLPWQSWPTHENVRVLARFVLSDGRLFEAERDVKVRLTPVEQRQQLPRPLSQPLQQSGHWEGKEGERDFRLLRPQPIVPER